MKFRRRRKGIFQELIFENRKCSGWNGNFHRLKTIIFEIFWNLKKNKTRLTHPTARLVPRQLPRPSVHLPCRPRSRQSPDPGTESQPQKSTICSHDWLLNLAIFQNYINSVKMQWFICENFTWMWKKTPSSPRKITPQIDITMLKIQILSCKNTFISLRNSIISDSALAFLSKKKIKDSPKCRGLRTEQRTDSTHFAANSNPKITIFRHQVKNNERHIKLLRNEENICQSFCAIVRQNYSRHFSIPVIYHRTRNFLN